MPQLGESIAEGTISRWLKKPGDHVDLYEPLVEVITDKVNAEIPSPVAGTLTEILVPEGATVPNLAEIAVIATAGEETAGEAAPRRSTATSRPGVTTLTPEPVPGRSADQPPIQAVAGAREALAPAPPSTASTQPAAFGGPQEAWEARTTPAVRRLLREHGLRPEQVTGTGGAGRITRDDVLAFVEAHPAAEVGSSEVPVAAQSSAAPPPAAAPGTGASVAVAQPLTTATFPAGPPAQTVSRPPTSSAPGRRVEFPAGADEVLVPASQMQRHRQADDPGTGRPARVRPNRGRRQCDGPASRGG